MPESILRTFWVAEPPAEGGPHIRAIRFERRQRRLVLSSPQRGVRALTQRRVPPRMPHVCVKRLMRLHETLLSILADWLQEMIMRFLASGIGHYQRLIGKLIEHQHRQANGLSLTR